MKRTREILRDYGYAPKKSRGQNFLVDESVLQKIADRAEIGPSDTVVEIGPGPGNLTRRLAKKAAWVIAVEIDHELASILKAELKADNVTVIEQDVMDMDFSSLAAGARIKVIANLPYNITTPVIFKLLSTPELFTDLVLLLQKEVAERICAPAGKKPYGILAARAQLLADCAMLFEVPARAFMPVPKVTSALIRVRLLPEPRFAVTDQKVYAEVVKAAFGQRRKTIINSLMGSPVGLDADGVAAALSFAGIDPVRRAETVTVEEFVKLANTISGGDR